MFFFTTFRQGALELISDTNSFISPTPLQQRGLEWNTAPHRLSRKRARSVEETAFYRGCSDTHDNKCKALKAPLPSSIRARP